MFVVSLHIMSQASPREISQLATDVLLDLRVYLDPIDPAIYQEKMPLLSGSSIGQHTRHIIEFYLCLVEQSSSGHPVIDYSKRRRDYRIESEPDYALSVVKGLVAQLNLLDPNRTCQLYCAEHGVEDLAVDTTIARELIYNIEHTIHHLAIIRIALQVVAPSLYLPESFGVAPSTLRHRHEACAQ